MTVGKTCANDVISLKSSIQEEDSDGLVLSLQMPLSEDFKQDLSSLFTNEMAEECPLTNYRISKVTNSSGDLTEADYLPMIGVSFNFLIVR